MVALLQAASKVPELSEAPDPLSPPLAVTEISAYMGGANNAVAYVTELETMCRFVKETTGGRIGSDFVAFAELGDTEVAACEILRQITEDPMAQEELDEHVQWRCCATIFFDWGAWHARSVAERLSQMSQEIISKTELTRRAATALAAAGFTEEQVTTILR